MDAPEPVSERVMPANITPERFEEEFVRAGEPVVFRGVCAGWPARTWSFEDIVRHWPKRTLPSLSTLSDALTERIIDLTPDEFAREFGTDAGPAGHKPHWRFDVFKDVPEFAKHIPPPPVFGEDPLYLVWLGRDTITRAHYHTLRRAMIFQLYGRKRVILCHPADSPRLYPYSILNSVYYHKSRVDFAAPDFDRFPDVRTVRSREAILEPGDGLFVPLHWWHAAYGEGTVMSASLFWKARLREHAFPHPGLRSAAGLFLWHVLPQVIPGTVRRFVKSATGAKT
jgi:hypothetical protein